jgi:hypothetical protein
VGGKAAPVFTPTPALPHRGGGNARPTVHAGPSGSCVPSDAVGRAQWGAVCDHCTAGPTCCLGPTGVSDSVSCASMIGTPLSKALLPGDHDDCPVSKPIVTDEGGWGDPVFAQVPQADGLIAAKTRLTKPSKCSGATQRSTTTISRSGATHTRLAPAPA